MKYLFKWEGMCTIPEEQVGGHTKTTPPNHGKRLQKLCRNGELFEHVLCRSAETVETSI